MNTSGKRRKNAGEDCPAQEGLSVSGVFTLCPNNNQQNLKRPRTQRMKEEGICLNKTVTGNRGAANGADKVNGTCRDLNAEFSCPPELTIADMPGSGNVEHAYTLQGILPKNADVANNKSEQLPERADNTGLQTGENAAYSCNELAMPTLTSCLEVMSESFTVNDDVFEEMGILDHDMPLQYTAIVELEKGGASNTPLPQVAALTEQLSAVQPVQSVMLEFIDRESTLQYLQGLKSTVPEKRELNMAEPVQRELNLTEPVQTKLMKPEQRELNVTESLGEEIDATPTFRNELSSNVSEGGNFISVLKSDTNTSASMRKAEPEKSRLPAQPAKEESVTANMGKNPPTQVVRTVLMSAQSGKDEKIPEPKSVHFYSQPAKVPVAFTETSTSTESRPNEMAIVLPPCISIQPAKPPPIPPNSQRAPIQPAKPQVIPVNRKPVSIQPVKRPPILRNSQRAPIQSAKPQAIPVNRKPVSIQPVKPPPILPNSQRVPIQPAKQQVNPATIQPAPNQLAKLPLASAKIQSLPARNNPTFAQQAKKLLPTQSGDGKSAQLGVVYTVPGRNNLQITTRPINKEPIPIKNDVTCTPVARPPPLAQLQVIGTGRKYPVSVTKVPYSSPTMTSDEHFFTYITKECAKLPARGRQAVFAASMKALNEQQEKYGIILIE